MIELDNKVTDEVIKLTETELKVIRLEKQMDMLNDRIVRGKTLQRLVWLLNNLDACYDAREGLFLRGMLSFKDIVDDKISMAEAELAFEKYLDNPNTDDEAILASGVRIQSGKIEGMRVVLGRPFTNWEESFDVALAETQMANLEQELALLNAEDI
jgi:hypothetical protein